MCYGLATRLRARSIGFCAIWGCVSSSSSSTELYKVGGGKTPGLSILRYNAGIREIPPVNSKFSAFTDDRDWLQPALFECVWGRGGLRATV